MCGPAIAASTSSAKSTGSRPASSGASLAARHSAGLVPSRPNAGLVDSKVRLTHTGRIALPRRTGRSCLRRRCRPDATASSPKVSTKSANGVDEGRERHGAVERSGRPVAGHVPRHHASLAAQFRQLRLPRQPAATQPVQQHQRRSWPGGRRATARFAPRKAPALDIGDSHHLGSLACSEIFVNGVDFASGRRPQSWA